jgi:hypothetical protein
MESELLNEPRPDLLDADTVYLNYLASCRHRGVDPVPREPARKLIDQWNAAIGPAMAREYSRRLP